MLTYDVSQRGDESIYEYLYLCIRADIENGTIPAGARLPSKRAFARHLGVSLITVEGAYSQLVAEGYVRSEPRRGYYACAIDGGATVRMAAGAAGLPAHAPARPPASSSAAPSTWSPRPASMPANANADAAAPLPSGALRPAARAGVSQGASRRMDASTPVAASACAFASCPNGSPLIADFSGGSLPLARFPFASWAKTMREVLSREPEQALLGDTCAQGALALREQLADYLRSFRGMRVDPSQIVVAAGSQVLYNLIVQLLGRDVGYAVETPGYPRLTSIYRANDVRLSHILLDEGGIRIDELASSGASVAHVMPSHQFPTGQVTSVSRRYELLGWASERPGRFIVEDDYDCEFRLSGRPIPSLMSVDASSCVIYTNTFAKSLGASFRIAYMVLPEALMGAYQERLGFYSSTVSTTEQLALAHFISSGEYERHVSRTRTYYRALRNSLVDALRTCPASDFLQVWSTDAGLHFLMRVDHAVPQERLVAAAWARGVRLSPLSGYCAPGKGAGAIAQEASAHGKACAQESKSPRQAPERSAAPNHPAPPTDKQQARSYQGAYVMSYAGLAPEQVAPAVDALSQAILDVLHA